ncbi:MAG TPA: Uma2 family endonuclease [Candidatus Baltobacteraceae bacterium]|nr:Uma2 family endonuclease [Candidatus Baltobacteraceae bacterium]
MQPIVEDQTKPATEWIAGKLVQKVTPGGPHAQAQTRICAALLQWADRCGTGWVGSEWDFVITPPGDIPRSLVPDVAFVSYERIPYGDEEAARIPHVAPDVVFEILSPKDVRGNVDEKIRVYLASGTRAVIEVDPLHHTVTIFERHSRTVLEEPETLRHDALPGFATPLAEIFRKPTPPPR